MKASSRRPLLLVVSAPSGAGKTTLAERLLAAFPRMVRSVSCTTRAPRSGEADGCDYFFLRESQFLEKIAAGAFLEYARVHGAYYGTPRAPVEKALQAGRDVLAIIDVQGAERIRQLAATPAGAGWRGAFVDIFVMPPDTETLRRRLAGRGLDSAEEIERRLKNAEVEMADASRYRYRLVNDCLEDAAARLLEIVAEEKQTSNAQRRTPNVQ